MSAHLLWTGLFLIVAAGELGRFVPLPWSSFGAAIMFVGVLVLWLELALAGKEETG